MLLFMDGMGHYDTAEIEAKWTAAAATKCSWTIAANGRTANAINRTATSTGTGVGQISIAPLTTRLGAWTPTATGGCGFAVRVQGLSLLQGSGNNVSHFFDVKAGSSSLFWIGLETNGTFSVYSGDAIAAFQGQSAEGLTEDTWMYFEVQWTIGATTGAVQIRVNGVQILNLTNIRTRSNLTSATTWNGAALLGLQYTALTSPLSRFCDFIIYDLATSVADDVATFLGDIKIDFVKPDGVGAQSDWTPSAGANWECVDEVPPNEDTDYVETTAPGDRDTYSFENVSADPRAIQICTYAKKGADGSAMIAPIMRLGGVDFDGPALGIASTSAYSFLTQAQDVNPDTLAQFTAAEFNAGEYGPLKDA